MTIISIPTAHPEQWWEGTEDPMAESDTVPMPDMTQPNYIDALAIKIGELLGDDEYPGSIWFDLYRIYAVLCLVTGEETTREDVHDAWAAFSAANNPTHRSLVPFLELTPDVQALDQPYVDAIRLCAKERVP